MTDVKVAACYIRRRRDYFGRWITRLGALRAIASSGSIAAWALWKELAFIWAIIIATSQVLDALKDVFPFTKKHKAASTLAIALDSLFIDAQMEWENIFSGKYADDEIIIRLHKLRKLQHDAECQNFPEGLAEQRDLFDLAQQDANNYISRQYSGVK